MHKLNTQRLRRAGADLSALAVALVAARATWDHISHVGVTYGESMALWLPVSIDGMMVAGVILTVDAAIMGRPRNYWAVAATWLGGLLSIAAQIESARSRGTIAMAIASTFSVTLIVTVEAIARSRKSAAAVPTREEHPVAAVLAAPVPAPTSPPPAGRPRAHRSTPARTPVRRESRKVLPAPAGSGEIGRVPISPLTGRPLVAK